VPTKTKKATKGSPKAAANPIQIVVRRGALRRFDSLKRATAELPVTLTWDRRMGERRDSSNATEGESRKMDRRQKPQFTWELADFVVVEREVPAESTKPKARKRR
jgi:hypothetical protein